MMTNATGTRVTELLATSLVWDNTFPFGPLCGSHEAHVATLGRMRAAGYACVSLTTASDLDDMPATIRKISHDRAWFSRNADRFTVVNAAEDIPNAKADGKLAVVLTFQGTLPFERDLGLVEIYHRLGIRQALMAYNQKNHVGDGCHERTDAGLSRFGIALVQEMQRVGMIVDCTHTGYRTTMDVLEMASAPVVFSHSNARALQDHERNIRDDQALACAQTGGVVGVNGLQPFLGGEASAADMFRHVDYWVTLLGPDHVGIALDYVSDLEPLMSMVRADRSKYPTGQYSMDTMAMFGPEQMPDLVELMLKAGYADEAVSGILGGNWLRVARRVWQ